jgi:hypothetical protein
MSGLMARRICPRALMKSDDQDPYQICELQAHVSQQVVFGLRWRPCRSSRFNALAKLQTVICATAPWICLQEGRRPYAFANISARKISPDLIIAQMIRASLLASATVTRRAGFFANQWPWPLQNLKPRQSKVGASMITRVWPISHVRLLIIFRASVLMSAMLLFSSHLALAQFTQQGSKLVGTDAIGLADQGHSVALSADGNTAIMGGYLDNNGAGAAWVYTRSGGVWTQQGSKLVGTGAVGGTEQGISVALSADGNTAVVGGYFDDSATGAAWVYTRRGGVWTQQGSKLVGSGAVGGAEQGWSVALSADGNTAIVGGSGDNSRTGAAWVFIRRGNVWIQQGSKLVGSGVVGDGNTAIVGGPGDNFDGAAWVYTRSGGVWTQQGSKLVGTGAVGGAEQGWSVALSADGDAAIMGGYFDSSGAGAAWVYTRSGGVWTQQGSKLVGSGAVGNAQQGTSVALSANANTAIIGGPFDNPAGQFVGVGAAWVFASGQPGSLRRGSLGLCVGAAWVFVREVLTPELKDNFFKNCAAQLYNVYGPTEAAIFAACGLCDENANETSVSIGRAITPATIEILGPLKGFRQIHPDTKASVFIGLAMSRVLRPTVKFTTSGALISR